jgi:hypothetical protein
MDLFRIATATAVLGFLGSPAQSEPACGDLERYLIGTEHPFVDRRRERVRDDTWKAPTSILGGNCEVTVITAPTHVKIDCSFNAKAAKAAMLSSYQSMNSYVQNCLNGSKSRDDWRRRDTSRTEYDGRVIAETTWTLTNLRAQTERKILVSNDSAGSPPAEYLLTVSWRKRTKEEL